MLKHKSVVILSVIMIITVLSGCNSSSSTLGHNDSTEASTVGTTEPTTEQTEDQIIYISGLSGSLKAVDEYSLTEDGELIRDYYFFDFDTKIYSPENSRIEWRDLMDYVYNNSDKYSKRTKCRIVSHNTGVKEAYLFR